MFDNYIAWFCNTPFYQKYIVTWPAPLNNPSIISLIFLVIVGFLLIYVWDFIRLKISRRRFKRSLREREMREEEELAMAKSSARKRAVMEEVVVEAPEVIEEPKKDDRKRTYSKKDLDEYTRISAALKRGGK